MLNHQCCSVVIIIRINENGTDDALEDITECFGRVISPPASDNIFFFFQVRNVSVNGNTQVDIVDKHNLVQLEAFDGNPGQGRSANRSCSWESKLVGR